MLENQCVTACRLNEAGSGSWLSDADSNLPCRQILESFSWPSLLPCGPQEIQHQHQVQRTSSSSKLYKWLEGKWDRVSTDFGLVKMREKRKRDSNLPYLETICFPSISKGAYSDQKACWENSNLESKRAVLPLWSHSNHLLQGFNKACSFFSL